MTQKDIYDLGLQADLAMASQSGITRRDAIKLGAIVLAAFLASCSPVKLTSIPEAVAGSTDAAAEGSASGEVCVDEIPGETAGPYPADGSNASNQRLNALALAGIVRQDLRTSLGTGNVAQGVPLNIEITLVNTNNNCAPLAGYAVYLWHCNQNGDYSMYSAATVDEDYLRGVQAADADGKLSFTTVYPGCYLGRWPHTHFEVYPSLEQTTGAENVIHTSQMAFPEDVCASVYESAGYETSARNLPQISLASDNIFSDGYESQMVEISGDEVNGYTAKITVGVAA